MSEFSNNENDDEAPWWLTLGVGALGVAGLGFGLSRFAGESEAKKTNNMAYGYDKSLAIQRPSSWCSTDACIDKLFENASRYDTYIKRWAKVHDLPWRVVKAFIMVESGGNPDVISFANKKIVGLMQVRYDYQEESVYWEITRDKLRPETKKFFESRGYKVAKYSSEAKGYGGLTPDIRRTDAFDPEFNIVLGTLLLSQMADGRTSGRVETWNKRGDELALDRVALIYNGGRKSPGGKLAATGNLSFKQLYEKAPNRTYLAKLFGAGGALERTGAI